MLGKTQRKMVALTMLARQENVVRRYSNLKENPWKIGWKRCCDLTKRYPTKEDYPICAVPRKCTEINAVQNGPIRAKAATYHAGSVSFLIL